MTADFKEGPHPQDAEGDGKSTAITTAVVASGDALKSTALVGKDPDASHSSNPFEALHEDIGWDRNTLSATQQATYHIRLLMTDDEPFDIYVHESYESLHKTLLEGKRTTTVAETGVTGLCITSLNINSIAAPNSLTRSMNATEIVLNIAEPGGVGFMDTLSQTAMELGVRNLYKAPMLLEVRFMGYNGDEQQGVVGDFNVNPCREFKNGGVWLYQVILNNIDVDLTVTGATYRCTFRPWSEQILNENDLRLPTHITPVGSTVKEMIDSMFKELNDHIDKMYGYPLRKYDIALMPCVLNGKEYDPADQGNFKIIPESPQLNDKRNVTMERVGESFKAHFPHGTKINDALEMIFANCEKAQQLAKDVQKTGDLELDEKRLREAVIHRFIPVAKATGYDFLTEQYLIEYTMISHPYKSQRPILTTTQVEVTKDPLVQRDNAIKLRKQGYLAKRYDYIFTGENTEIIQFDIKLNTPWVAMLPRAMGGSNSVESNTHNDVWKRPELTEYQGLMQQKREKETANKVAEDEIRRLKALPKDKQSFNHAEQLASHEESRKSVFRDIERLDAKLLEGRDKFDKGRRELENTRTSRLNVDPNRAQHRYAEELDNKQNADAYHDYSPMPLSMAQSSADNRFYASGSFPDAYHRDRAIFGAVMDQLYETTGGALQNINMEIRGDPYWLGSSNIEVDWAKTKQGRDRIPVDLDNGNKYDTRRPDYAMGDVLFLLTYRYPRGVLDNGKPDIHFNDFFTGVFAVKRVTSKFEGGAFTQNLEAFRMPTIEAFRAFGLRSHDEHMAMARGKADDSRKGR